MADYVHNQKAKFNYEILEEFEAGIELLGFEVKAIRAGRGQLDGARIIVRGAEAYLVGFDLPPYQAHNVSETYNSMRTRKILIKKSEIQKLGNTEKEKGLTIIPISLYNKGSKIKVRIAVVRGKKKFDKREVIKKREVGRELNRLVKTRR